MFAGLALGASKKEKEKGENGMNYHSNKNRKNMFVNPIVHLSIAEITISLKIVHNGYLK